MSYMKHNMTEYCMEEIQQLNEIIQQQDDYIEQLENSWLVLCGKKLGLFRRKGFS